MRTNTITLRELTLRYAPKRGTEGKALIIGANLSDVRVAAAPFEAIMRDEPCEVFGMLCLSTKNRVIAYHEVSRGTLDATLDHLREVFKAELLANAAGMILGPNHPSGDPTPSPDDSSLTAGRAVAERLLGVPVLDHLVIGDGRTFSFRFAGRL